MTTGLILFRNDLRLEDNPALEAACRGGAVVPVFVWSPEEEGAWPMGAAARWWLCQSLKEVRDSLERLGSRLIVRAGRTLEVVRELVRETGAEAVHWNRRYEPAVVERDRQLKAGLREAGVRAESYKASLLFEPWTVQTKQGRPFQVYTPFWNAVKGLEVEEPGAGPRALSGPKEWPGSMEVEDLGLEPRIDWAAGMRKHWEPGEEGARRRLERFLSKRVTAYAEQRDRPDVEGTSSLSPHLHFGEISPRRVWHAVLRAGGAETVAGLGRGAEVYLKEVVWREFAHHLLFHYPHTAEEPLREAFGRFPWRVDREGLRAWQRGSTGYPLVDAGMRQLWAIGWMHNRVRMVVASFLVKHLLVSWQDGARWFWDTLVDADLASNTLGWQWTAGCGADAAPYFRIFNPVSQGEKFDPAGEYVGRWVPELARVPTKYIHRPWEAPAEVLDSAGVVLGRDYPRPVVDHAEGRERALAALATISK